MRVHTRAPAPNAEWVVTEHTVYVFVGVRGSQLRLEHAFLKKWSRQRNNSKLMIAVAAAALIAGTSGVVAQQPGGASIGQTAPKPSGGQTTGQPAAPGAVHNGAPETKAGKENQSTERPDNRTERNKATNGAS
jgi:hypothetical protein